MKQSEYYLRIFVFFLKLAVIITTLVVVTVHSYSVLNYFWTSEPAPKKTTKIVKPVTCTLSNTSFTLTPNSPETEEKKTVKFKLSIQNKSEKPCYILSVPPDLNIQISSGDELIHDWASCQLKTSPRPRLLLPGRQEWSSAWTWDGIRTGDKCSGKDPAKPGTYKIKLLVHGKSAGDPIPFVIKESPKPSPSPSSSKSPSDAS